MRERKNARQTINFLMPACLIVCNRSYSFSLQLLFKQDIAWLHQRKLILTIAVFGCFTMKWVLWPNAPIIGGWAVLFTPRKYIFISDFFPGRFATSGFMIRLSVLEIEGGTLSVTEEKEKKEKDWSWSILVVGFVPSFFFIRFLSEYFWIS